MAAGAQGKKRALQLSLFAIASVFVFELVGGLLTNSLALITDSTHALLDATVTAVLIVAIRLSLKPRDTDHTYGHGKIETIGGLIGGIALLALAAVFIIEAASRILVPGKQQQFPVEPGTIGFAAVAYTMAVAGFRIFVLNRALGTSLGKADPASALSADLYHAFADLGSTAVVFVGLLLVSYGFARGDSVAAIVLGGFLAFLSSRFAYRNALELSDVISPKLVARARHAALETRGVLESRDVKMRKVGRDVFVDMTISLSNDTSFEKAHQTSAEVERNVASALSQELGGAAVTVMVHFEPSDKPESTAPRELLTEKAAFSVPGVRGVHNVLVSKAEGKDTVGISLHVQVDRTASLYEAHQVANAVEDAIRSKVPRVDSVVVHLEPFITEIGGVEPFADTEAYNSVVRIVQDSPRIGHVGRVALYKTSEHLLKVDVECTFEHGDKSTIEEVHEQVSEIEKKIQEKFPGSIVTIHSEPE